MSASRSFAESPQSVRLARRFVAEQLNGLEPDVASMAVAAVSELATNCILHAASDFSVTVAVDVGLVRVEVTDYGPGTPVQLSPAVSDRSGRGLNILESITDEWGVANMSDSKTVWFTISRENGDAPPSAAAAAERTSDAGEVTPASAVAHGLDSPSTPVPDSLGPSDPPTASSTAPGSRPAMTWHEPEHGSPLRSWSWWPSRRGRRGVATGFRRRSLG